jgi:Tfp pilus assembly protein FimT
MALMGLMAGMVVPRMAGSLDRMNARTAARKVSAALRYARSQAASEGALYVARLDADENALRVGPMERDGSGDGFDEKRMRVFVPSRGVRFRWADPRENRHRAAEPPEIRFFPSGGSTGGELIVFDEDGREYAVAVDRLTGLAEVRGE